MTLTPPQPPTAPAPAIRPTPPTPPRIDKTPFEKNSAEKIDDESPETQAKEAVANGAGALTKRTVERAEEKPVEEKPAPANQKVTVIPPDAPLVSDTQSDYDRGRDVLREFRELDAREAQSANLPAQTSTTEQKQIVPAKINYREGHGGFFWVFTIIFVAVAAVVIVKKFLFTEKPALTATNFFDGTADKLKAIEEKVKPAKLPPKKDDEKGKHFEARV